MDILLDAVIALLSCIGIWTLGRMIIAWLKKNRGEAFDASVEPDPITKEAEEWTKQKNSMK